MVTMVDVSVIPYPSNNKLLKYNSYSLFRVAGIIAPAEIHLVILPRLEILFCLFKIMIPGSISAEKLSFLNFCNNLLISNFGIINC